MRTRLLAVCTALVAVVALDSSSVGVGTGESTSAHPNLTAAQVDAIINPTATKNVVHCAQMAYGKMSVGSCAEHPITKETEDASEPEAAPGDYVWDPEFTHTGRPATPRNGFLPAVRATVTRAVGEDPSVDSGVGSRYVDLWAAHHGMTHRDVMMHVPMQDEPVRVEWADAPDGSVLHAGDESIPLQAPQGAVIVVMTKGDLSALSIRPQLLSLAFPGGRWLPLAPTAGA